MNANVRKYSTWLFLLGMSIPAALTLIAFAARFSWRCELITHFRAHYLVVLTLGTITLAIIRRFKTAALFGGLALVNLWFVAPLYVPSADALAGDPLRLLTVNVRGSNHSHEKALDLIEEADPDAILVLEVRPHWAEALDALADEYPHQLVHARPDGWGIAFFSRLSCPQLEVQNIGPGEIPSIVAEIETPNGMVHLVGTHPAPPISSDHFAFRNEQFAALAKFASAYEGPTILVGDLNSTSFSPMFRDLLAASGLRDSRNGFGIQPTWPSRFVPFGVTIDHVLVSQEVAVRQRVVLPDVGSDHRPVMAELIIPGDERN
jgi:endonuclease/exonuclease/phosphatase (EEP) superfamily protein YafD